MGTCLSRQLNLQEMTEKQKQRFLIEYQKRFKVRASHLQRQRNFAHPKLLQQAQAISSRQSPVEQEQKHEEAPKEEVKEEQSPMRRSPSLTKSLLHESPQEYENEALQLFEKRFRGRDRYLRGLGPITGISLLKHNQNSPRRSMTLDSNTEVEQRFSYMRPSILEGRNLRTSQTPSQNLIQNLLNEYLPLSPNENSGEVRLSAFRKSKIQENEGVASFDNGEEPLKSNHQPIKLFEHRTERKLEIIPLTRNQKLEKQDHFDEMSTRGQYGVTQYTNGELITEHRLTADNINDEIGRVLEEEQELKETVRIKQTLELDNQTHSDWGGMSQDESLEGGDNDSELQILDDDGGLTSLKEGQVREDREFMDDYLKRSSITQER